MEKYLFSFIILCCTSVYAQKCLLTSDRQLYKLCSKNISDLSIDRILVNTCTSDIYESFRENDIDSIRIVKKGGWTGWREPLGVDDFFINLTEAKDIKLLKKQLRRKGLYNGNLNGKMNLKLWSVIRTLMLTYDSQSLINVYIQSLDNAVFYPKTLISKNCYKIIMNSCYDIK